jgi:hypothetical protein
MASNGVLPTIRASESSAGGAQAKVENIIKRT